VLRRLAEDLRDRVDLAQRRRAVAATCAVTAGFARHAVSGTSCPCESVRDSAGRDHRANRALAIGGAV